MYSIIRWQCRRGAQFENIISFRTNILENLNFEYRRFIAGPTLNNSKKEVDFFWKSSLNVVENVAKFEILLFFFF